MLKRMTLLALLAAFPAASMAQTVPVSLPQSPDGIAAGASQSAALPSGTLLLTRDTLIALMVVNEVTTKTAKVGDRFLLRVNEKVVVNGTTVIPIGAKAWGEVVSAESSGVVGKSGKLSARLLYIELPHGHLAIRGDNRSAGAGGTAETVMGVIGIGILGLLTRGNNAKLKAGEILIGYPADDQLFEMASGTFRQKALPQTVQASSSQ